MLGSRMTLALQICLAILASGVLSLQQRTSESPGAKAPAAGHAPAGATRSASAEQDCARRRATLELEPALPGAPQLEALRAEIVARARAEPVLFLEAPRQTDLSSEMIALREGLFHEAQPWRAFSKVMTRYRRAPRELRKLILTDGYLYADQPSTAALLTNSIALNQLFSERAIVVTRGNRTLHASRKNGDYFWTDGPERDLPARLWLFDRVAVDGEHLGPSSLVALGAVRDESGATSIEIERVTRDAVLAQLVYRGLRIPAILAIQHNELHLDCQAGSVELNHQVEAARALSKRKSVVMARLRAAIDEEVAEALPFDEPKTEEGQQDGKLRHEWRMAYQRGYWSYEFNGDRYAVFGAKGRPRVPQVCVDFIVDSWERLADTRWLGRDEGRGRKVGRIDFDKLDIENRRSVDRLIEFAKARPQWFDVLEFTENERVRFLERHHFFQRLYDLRTEFQPGDVVAILGPRDDEKLHYHSFFIVADDPITRMPTLLAANAGRPRLRSWEAEMQNAPRRSILARIRPRLVWLESLAGVNSAGPDDLDSNGLRLSKLR